jgi:hypothetical protein
MSPWLDTHRQRVEILLTGRRVITGDVHLLLAAESHSGQETPIDLLNRDEAFFAVTLEGEQPVFVAKSQVLSILIPLEAAAHDPAHDPARESAARRLEFEVELADGSMFEGAVHFELPPDRLRLLDFLNLTPPFFALESADAMRLLNRGHVRAVSPLAQV